MSSPAAILSGSPASPTVQLKGTGVIAAAAVRTGVIAVPGVSASSVIVAWGVGAADATATVFSADVVSAGSFTISAGVAATADKNVGWAILSL